MPSLPLARRLASHDRRISQAAEFKRDLRICRRSWAGRRARSVNSSAEELYRRNGKAAKLYQIRFHCVADYSSRRSNPTPRDKPGRKILTSPLLSLNVLPLIVEQPVFGDRSSFDQIGANSRDITRHRQFAQTYEMLGTSPRSNIKNFLNSQTNQPKNKADEIHQRGFDKDKQEIENKSKVRRREKFRKVQDE